MISVLQWGIFHKPVIHIETHSIPSHRVRSFGLAGHLSPYEMNLRAIGWLLKTKNTPDVHRGCFLFRVEWLFTNLTHSYAFFIFHKLPITSTEEHDCK